MYFQILGFTFEIWDSGFIFEIWDSGFIIRIHYQVPNKTGFMLKKSFLNFTKIGPEISFSFLYEIMQIEGLGFGIKGICAIPGIWNTGVFVCKVHTVVGGSKARKFFSKKANRALEPPSGL